MDSAGAMNELSGSIIGASIEVHKALGPGLLINFNVPVLIDGVERIVNGDPR